MRRTEQQPATDQTWRKRAACHDQPIEFFFGDDNREHAPVLNAMGRTYCDRCPVREECLDWALAGGRDVYGMWGGTTQREREALLRHIKRAKCPVCASGHLGMVAAGQVCLDCGQSWTTMRPSAQTRLNADAAA